MTEQSRIVAFYDANVLYSATLRDTLMYLALSSLIEAKWTAIVQAEWLHHIVQNRPDLEQSKLERTQALMNLAVPNALVEGFESLIETLILPDPADRHVLAAAIHCKANVIVTANLKDFPHSTLEIFGVEALHPDEFICRLLEINAAAVIAALKLQREAMKYPAMDVDAFLQMLEHKGLTSVTQWLKPFAVLI